MSDVSSSLAPRSVSMHYFDVCPVFLCLLQVVELNRCSLWWLNRNPSTIDPRLATTMKLCNRRTVSSARSGTYHPMLYKQTSHEQRATCSSVNFSFHHLTNNLSYPRDPRNRHIELSRIQSLTWSPVSLRLRGTDYEVPRYIAQRLRLLHASMVPPLADKTSFSLI